MIARNRARHGKTLWTEGEAGRAGASRRPVGRPGGGPLRRRRGRGLAASGRQAQPGGGAGARRLPDPRVRGAVHPARACPIGSSAARASTSGRRSATRSPICGSSASPTTIWPSSGSSICRGAASATARCAACARRRAPRQISLFQAARAMCQTDELPARARNALRRAARDLRPLARQLRERPPRELAETHPRRMRLYRDVAGRAHARRARAAREPQGAGQGRAGVRDAAGLPGACQPGDGERGDGRRRHGQHHDAARCQGAGVRQRLPRRLGGGAVPEPACHRRGRHQGARGGAAAGLCRHHPRAAPADGQLRRQPARLQSMVVQRALALRRRAAARAYRASASQPRDPARSRHFPRRRAVHGPPDQPVPLAPGRARQADRGQGRDPAVAATGQDRRRSSPATGSSTTSSATGRSSRSRATSSTSPSSIRAARRSSTASSSRPETDAWPTRTSGGSASSPSAPPCPRCRRRSRTRR